MFLQGGAGRKIGMPVKVMLLLPVAGRVKFPVKSVVGFPSGQREQTVNLSSQDYGGSSPPPTTSFMLVLN